MRILVLGHTGYLGAHAAAQLGALAGVRLFGGGRGPGAALHVDLTSASPHELAESLAELRPDVVVNCAGAVGGDPVTLAEVNARGPAVLAAALYRSAPRARLVHLGSAAEYGTAAHGVRVTEADATRPAGPYGATKLAGTLAVTTSGLDAVVLRVGNPVGPGAPAAGLPGRLARELYEAGDDPDAVVRLGDLSAYRDFVDARDVARAVVLAATAKGPLPPLLNVSGGRAVPVRDLVRALVRVSGFRGRVEEDAAQGSARSAEVSWQCSDIAAAGSTLGWRPEYVLEDSLRALWEAVRDAAQTSGQTGSDARGPEQSGATAQAPGQALGEAPGQAPGQALPGAPGPGQGRLGQRAAGTVLPGPPAPGHANCGPALPHGRPAPWPVAGRHPTDVAR